MADRLARSFDKSMSPSILVRYYNRFVLLCAQKHEGWSFILKATSVDFFGYIPSGISSHLDEKQKPVKDSNPNYPPPTKPVIEFQVSYYSQILPFSNTTPDPVTTICGDVKTYLSDNYKDCW